MPLLHSPNPCLITRDNSLVSVTCTLNPVEEEYLHTLCLTPQAAQNFPTTPSIGHTPTATNVHTTLATSAVRTFTPDASSTNPSASHGCHTSCILSSATCHPTCGDTQFFSQGYPSGRGGADTSLFSCPCTAIPKHLPSSILASIPTVYCSPTRQF